MQEVDDLHQGLLGLVLTGHVFKGDAGLFFHVDLGVGLADAAQTAAHLARHAAEQEGEEGHHDDHGQQPGDQEAHHRGELGLIRRAEPDIVLPQKGEQAGIIERGAVVAAGFGELLLHTGGALLAGQDAGKELAVIFRCRRGEGGDGLRVQTDRSHIFLEIDGKLVAGHRDGVDLVLLHQGGKFTVLNEGGVGLVGHGQEVVHQNGDHQGP